MKFKRIVKQIIPPFILELLKAQSRYGWHGDYANWKEARIQCGGYEQENIVEKVEAATLKVKKGEAIFERDSVLFDNVEYSWPLLSALMWVAALNKGKISVLDFGGSLGSTYFQNKKFLDTLDVSWNIVEQESFVKRGKQTIQDNRLQFFTSVDEATRASGVPDILIIACTLPYIGEPYALLKELMKHHIPFLVVDNTPFNYETRDRITVQTVYPSIYQASYPCWLLDYKKVIATVEKEYSIISEHLNNSKIYVDGRRVRYRGFLAGSKSNTYEHN